MKVVIAQAVGKTVVCPECGTPAPVKPAQDRTLAHQESTPIISAAAWYEVTCPRSGRKLYPASQVVELMPETSHVR